MGHQECINSVNFDSGKSGNWKLGMDIECLVPHVNDMEAKVLNYYSIKVFFLDNFAYLGPILANQNTQLFSKNTVKLLCLEATTKFYRMFMKGKFNYQWLLRKTQFHN